jgi:hypothetical protein
MNLRNRYWLLAKKKNESRLSCQPLRVFRKKMVREAHHAFQDRSSAGPNLEAHEAFPFPEPRMSEASSILIETTRCLGFVMCAACHSLWFVEPCSRGRAHTQWARTHGAPTSRSPIGLGNDPSHNWQLHTEYSAVGPVTAFCPHSAGEAGRGIGHAA